MYSIFLRLLLFFSGLALIATLKGLGLVAFFILVLIFIKFFPVKTATAGLHDESKEDQGVLQSAVALSYMFGACIISFIVYHSVVLFVDYSDAVALASSLESYSIIESDFTNLVAVLERNLFSIPQDNSGLINETYEKKYIARYWAFMSGAFWHPLFAALFLGVFKKWHVEPAIITNSHKIVMLFLFVGVLGFGSYFFWHLTPISEPRSFPLEWQYFALFIPMYWWFAGWSLIGLVSIFREKAF